MAPLTAPVAALLMLAGVQADGMADSSQLQGFLSKASAGDYDKFITPNLQHMKQGGGLNALADRNSPAEHAEKSAQKIYANDSNMSLPAIGIGLFSLSAMLGFGLRSSTQRSMQSSSLESGNALELETQGVTRVKESQATSSQARFDPCGLYASGADASRRELGQGLLGAVGLFGSQAAFAEAGASPNFSFFGFFGNGSRMSEGAMYGSDQSGSVYSPYSVYGPRDGADVVYKRYNSKEIDFKRGMLAESEKRVKNVLPAIEKKNWESVRRDLDSQVYNMRNTMNYLAAGPSAKPGAKAAAKQFYQDMESVNLLCKRKKQDAAKEAYSSMMASLDSFNKLI
jgi:hypothetical protein